MVHLRDFASTVDRSHPFTLDNARTNLSHGPDLQSFEQLVVRLSVHVLEVHLGKGRRVHFLYPRNEKAKVSKARCSSWMTCLWVCQSTYLPTYLSVFKCDWLYVCLWEYRSVCKSFYQSICQSINLYLSEWLSVCVSMWLTDYLRKQSNYYRSANTCSTLSDSTADFYITCHNIPSRQR